MRGNEAQGRALTAPSAWMPTTRLVLALFIASLTAALIIQTCWYEIHFVALTADVKSIALIVSFVLFLASGLALLSRRPLASIALAGIVMVLLTNVSVVKFYFLRSGLHALDFYYLARPTELHFLSKSYTGLFYTGLATAFVTVVVAVVLFRVDTSRVSRSRAALLVVLALLLLAGSYRWRGQRDGIYHFTGHHHVSGVVASFPDALSVFLQGGLLKSADRGGTVNSKPETQVVGATETPTIILSILHESSFPTRQFPVQCGGPVPTALYTSSNGARYDLNVETYGGATWITEYGLLLGISTYYFGDARSYIGYSMQNRARDSLALQLKKTGFKTIALYPSPKTFVNTDNFYKAIGFDEVFDYYDMKAKTEYERDQFYFSKALDQIRAHRASGSRAPLYLFLWTEATHGPYDYVAHPDAKPDVAPGAGPICAKDASWAEYIRRLLISESDLAWLNRELKAEFPDERVMILGYGDHQPYITQPFLDPNAVPPAQPERSSSGYRTFFRITGVNFEPDWSSVPKSVDTPFLGNVMMQAARLPRHGFYNDRDKLMRLCGGRYSGCEAQDEILSFHHRMIEAGTILDR